MCTCKKCGTTVARYDHHCLACGIDWPGEKPWKEKSFKERYFSFEGRLNRKRFIIFTLISLIPTILTNVWIDLAFRPSSTNYTYLLLAILFAIPTIWFNFSAAIRRWHDLNKSGNYAILNILANSIFIVAIILLPFLCIKRGTIGDNRYGSDMTK